MTTFGGDSAVDGNGFDADFICDDDGYRLFSCHLVCLSLIDLVPG
jgi:hypothetical protein